MNKFERSRRVLSGLFLLVFAFASMASARPMSSLFLAQDDTKKLPPVNWIRSRSIDIKNIVLDLRFDWTKEQAIGSEVI